MFLFQSSEQKAVRLDVDEQLQKCMTSPNNVQKYQSALERLRMQVRKNNQSAIEQIVDRVKATIKDDDFMPVRKYQAILLLRDLMHENSKALGKYVVKKILKRLVILAQHKATSQDEDRGRDIFGPVKKDQELYSIRFLNTLLAAIEDWSMNWPKVPDGPSQDFQNTYKELVLNYIKFPKKEANQNNSPKKPIPVTNKSVDKNTGVFSLKDENSAIRHLNQVKESAGLLNEILSSGQNYEETWPIGQQVIKSLIQTIPKGDEHNVKVSDFPATHPNRDKILEKIAATFDFYELIAKDYRVVKKKPQQYQSFRKKYTKQTQRLVNVLNASLSTTPSKSALKAQVKPTAEDPKIKTFNQYRSTIGVEFQNSRKVQEQFNSGNGHPKNIYGSVSPLEKNDSKRFSAKDIMEDQNNLARVNQSVQPQEDKIVFIKRDQNRKAVRINDVEKQQKKQQVVNQFQNSLSESINQPQIKDKKYNAVKVRRQNQIVNKKEFPISQKQNDPFANDKWGNLNNSQKNPSKLFNQVQIKKNIEVPKEIQNKITKFQFHPPSQKKLKNPQFASNDDISNQKSRSNNSNSSSNIFKQFQEQQLGQNINLQMPARRKLKGPQNVTDLFNMPNKQFSMTLGLSAFQNRQVSISQETSNAAEFKQPSNLSAFNILKEKSPFSKTVLQQKILPSKMDFPPPVFSQSKVSNPFEQSQENPFDNQSHASKESFSKGVSFSQRTSFQLMQKAHKQRKQNELSIMVDNQLPEVSQHITKKTMQQNSLKFKEQLQQVKQNDPFASSFQLRIQGQSMNKGQAEFVFDDFRNQSMASMGFAGVEKSIRDSYKDSQKLPGFQSGRGNDPFQQDSQLQSVTRQRLNVPPQQKHSREPNTAQLPVSFSDFPQPTATIKNIFQNKQINEGPASIRFSQFSHYSSNSNDKKSQRQKQNGKETNKRSSQYNQSGFNFDQFKDFNPQKRDSQLFSSQVIQNKNQNFVNMVMKNVSSVKQYQQKKQQSDFFNQMQLKKSVNIEVTVTPVQQAISFQNNPFNPSIKSQKKSQGQINFSDFNNESFFNKTQSKANIQDFQERKSSVSAGKEFNLSDFQNFNVNNANKSSVVDPFKNFILSNGQMNPSSLKNLPANFFQETSKLNESKKSFSEFLNNNTQVLKQQLGINSNQNFNKIENQMNNRPLKEQKKNYPQNKQQQVQVGLSDKSFKQQSDQSNLFAKEYFKEQNSNFKTKQQNVKNQKSQKSIKPLVQNDFKSTIKEKPENVQRIRPSNIIAMLNNATAQQLLNANLKAEKPKQTTFSWNLIPNLKPITKKTNPFEIDSLKQELIDKKRAYDQKMKDLAILKADQAEKREQYLKAMEKVTSAKNQTEQFEKILHRIIVDNEKKQTQIQQMQKKILKINEFKKQILKREEILYRINTTTARIDNKTKSNYSSAKKWDMFDKSMQKLRTVGHTRVQF